MLGVLPKSLDVNGIEYQIRSDYRNILQIFCAFNDDEPIITKITDAFSKAITYVNAFFAMLSGKSTVTVAKKQTASYADSLKDASEQAEELKRQVYGFDELNKRSSDKKSDSNSNKDGPTADLFEEVPIDSILPDKLKEFFDKLKAAIKAGDWYGMAFNYHCANGKHVWNGSFPEWNH